MKKNFILFLIYLGLIVIVFLIFKNWFSFYSLSSGDWSHKFPEMIRGFTLYPYAWDPGFFNGLGGTTVFLLALNTYFLSTTSLLFNFFHVPWVLIERLVWFWPFLIISVFSSYNLFKKLFSEKFALLSSFIFLFNAYILMIVGGGQMGIAMSYSIVPLVLYFFIILNENIKLKYSLLLGILFGILVMLDLRIAYVTLSALGIYFLFNIKQLIIGKNLKEIVVNISYIFIIPFAVIGFLHAFWILPLLIFHQNPVQSFGAVYTSAEAVKFFSFAKFENTISLLHPNWPENIFGKVGFMKPEFLILPILAYSSLLFINKLKSLREKKYIIFFTLLGLNGSFLAKGANEPFGGIYLWLFDHFPGFIMFRDPTKWYTLVAISYSMLIPFTIWKIYEWLRSRSKFFRQRRISLWPTIFNTSNLFLLIIVFCLLYLIRPALLGQLTGTFKATAVPSDYIKLEKFLSSENSFSRVLWVPTLQRFGYYSNNHPAVSANDFFKTGGHSNIFNKINITEGSKILQEAGVRYVIVPYDSQGEIFLKDRKYDEKSYLKTIKDVEGIKWLKKVDCSIAKLLNCSDPVFGKVAVFEVPNPRDHFWSPSGNIIKNYKYINPTKYIVELKNAKKGDVVVFSESFDKNWVAYNSSFKIHSTLYENRFNSFVLPQDGDYSITIYYTPQDWVNRGLVISIVSLVGIIAILIGFKLKKW